MAGDHGDGDPGHAAAGVVVVACRRLFVKGLVESEK
jgi:hypothetical protein